MNRKVNLMNLTHNPCPSSNFNPIDFNPVYSLSSHKIWFGLLEIVGGVEG